MSKKAALTSGPLTEVKNGVMEALKNDEGAIPNESLRIESRARRKAVAQLTSAVRQTRPPVEPFICERCTYRGRTPAAMYDHAILTGHLTFTKANG